MNRLVEVASGTTIVAQYQYDGQNRRTGKLTNLNSSGVPQNVVYYFYSGQQVVETRTGAQSLALRRFLHSTSTSGRRVTSTRH